MTTQASIRPKARDQRAWRIHLPAMSAGMLVLMSWSSVPPRAAEQPRPESLSAACGTPIGVVYPSTPPTLREIDLKEAIVGAITFPEVIKKVPPEYPRSARVARISGSVIVNIVVCRDGSVEGTLVLKAPSKELAEAASKVVRKWVYRPATRDGEPVAVYLPVKVDFTLTEP